MNTQVGYSSSHRETAACEEVIFGRTDKVIVCVAALQELYTELNGGHLIIGNRLLLALALISRVLGHDYII